MGNLPFGQGESVTPIQIATAYAAIANGGILRPAHIVQSIGGKPVKVPAGHRIISTTTAAELRNMLRGVFGEGGTASGAAIPGYDMAGKTGTANIAINGKYSDSEYVASFVGMVPGQRSPAARPGGGRRAAGLDLRRLGGRAGVPEDRRLGGAVLRAQPALVLAFVCAQGPGQAAQPVVPLAADLRPSTTSPRSAEPG